MPYAACLRAAHFCSSVEGFHTEPVRFDVSLLSNHYAPVFIQLQTDRFFRLNSAMLAKNAMNPVVYQQLHQKSVNQNSRHGLKIFQSTQDLFRSPNVLQPNRWDTNVMYPRYTFDLTSTVHLNNRLINGGIISIDIQDPQYASCKST